MTLMTNRKLLLVSLLTILVLGLGMPSCPGQQAMQQQLDGVQTTANDNNKKIQQLTSQVNMLNTEVGKLKEVLTQATATIEAHQGAIKQMEDSIKAIQALPPASKSSSSSKKSKKHK